MDTPPAVEPKPRRVTKTMLRRANLEALSADLSQMNELRHAAGAVIDYALSLTPDCELQPGSRCEWIMRKNNWIAFTFSYGNYKKKLHISLDIWPGNLDDLGGMERKQGRFSGWAKITMERIDQLPTVFHHIKTTRGLFE